MATMSVFRYEVTREKHFEKWCCVVITYQHFLSSRSCSLMLSLPSGNFWLRNNGQILVMMSTTMVIIAVTM